LWHPIGGAEMEVLSWELAESEAPAGYKERALKAGIRNFGAAGVFEQDDMELWTSATNAGNNRIAQQFPYGFQTSLRYLDNPEISADRPGRIFRPSITEVVQFEFMRHWDALMTRDCDPARF
jgi:hypothetical protein